MKKGYKEKTEIQDGTKEIKERIEKLNITRKEEKKEAE